MTRSTGIDLEKSKTKKNAKTSDDNLHQEFRPKQHLFTNNLDYDIVLKYEIHHAEGLDNLTTDHALVTNKAYSVESWIDPSEGKVRTKRVFGLPNPVWNKKCYVKLNRFWDLNILHVEVLRHGFWSEPGTSNGVVCVGRVRIPLPKELYTSKRERFELVRLAGGELKDGGHITVTMELMNY